MLLAPDPCPFVAPATRTAALSDMVSSALFKAAVVAALQELVCAVTITDIQGASFLSPLRGQSVQNLTGIVTAKVRLFRE